jgi:hypothetical protein
MELLILLTTSTQCHLNTSKNADNLEAGAQIVRDFIESNDLGSSDLRGDFGETYETRERHDGHGNEAKHIGYINFNGTFTPRKELQA